MIFSYVIVQPCRKSFLPQTGGTLSLRAGVNLEKRKNDADVLEREKDELPVLVNQERLFLPECTYNFCL